MNMDEAQAGYQILRELMGRVQDKLTTEEENQAIGADRRSKLVQAVERLDTLEKQAEQQFINDFKKRKVTGLKVKKTYVKNVKQPYADVRWKKTKDAEQYEVFASNKKNKGYKNVEVTSSSDALVSFKKGKSCYVKVRAYRSLYNTETESYMNVYSIFSKPIKIRTGK